MKDQDVLDIIKKDKWMMDILRTVEKLKLSDWWIGAGFVRSKVWDYLHGYSKRTPLPDIDVIYFDSKNISEDSEKDLESKLRKISPKLPWSVKNQGRMALIRGDGPYNSASDGLSRWVETATCVGVCLNNGKLELTAPHGIDDLVSLILRPSPSFQDNIEVFDKRVKNKMWLKKWPKLKIVKHE